MMQVHQFHRWDVTPRQAMQIQEELRAKVIARGSIKALRFIAGADAAFAKDAERIYVAVVVLRFPSLDIVDTVIHSEKVRFPYVPGLLSFREAPALLNAFGHIRHEPDLIFIDGHGFSHPRRAGIACHVGLLLDRPVVGCAKSLLIGNYDEPGPMRGATTDLIDGDGQVIGAVVRTRDRVRPVFVSVGHRIGLDQAVRLTLQCTKGFRLPEPTRQADLLAGLSKRDAEGDTR